MERLLQFCVALEKLFCDIERRLGVSEWFILFRCSLLTCPMLTMGLLERKAFLIETPMKGWSAYMPLAVGFILNYVRTRNALAWCLRQQWTNPHLIWFGLVTLAWLFSMPWVDPVPWLPNEFYTHKVDFFVGVLLVMGIAWWCILLLVINKISGIVGVPLCEKLLKFLNDPE